MQASEDFPLLLGKEFVKALNIPTPDNSSFSNINPFLQLGIDSTSLGALKTCPRYYQYSIVQGYVPRSESIHLTFGTLFHGALEFYDRLKADGFPYYDAINETLRWMLTNTWNQKLGRPWLSDMPNKNRETLIRSVLWYLDQFKDDPLETIIFADGTPAVEKSFRFECGLQSSEGEDFLLCGHLDRMVNFHGKSWIVDRKTTSGSLSNEYFDRYSPDNQMSLYALAGTIVYQVPIAGLIIDACQVLVTGTRFQRGIVNRTKSQHEEWYADLSLWLKLLETYATARYWPMNDKSCQQYGGCPYRQVCGSSPEVRPQLLENLYHKRTWDPLITREV